MQIETERLILKRPKLADVPTLFQFLGNPEAMAFTQVDASMRDCRRRVAVHERQRRRHGYAPWTIRLRDGERIIGWGGLYDDPFDSGWGVELGYFFHPDAWGQGYASELAGAALAFADWTLGLPSVTAFAHPDNAGSQRVLDKAGFKVVRFLPDMDRLWYERKRPRAGYA